MKTLDEVINALELCTGDYDCVGYECPYRQEGTCCDLVAVPKMQADALHYLKEYRTTQTAYIKAMADLEDNPPMTWTELKQMEGKPVWLEDENGQGEWVLLSGMEEDELYFVYRTCNEYKLYRHEQGTRWQAYRKERE